MLFFDEDGGARRHAPDLFARRRDGTGLVMDCRADERVRARDTESFAATERACELVGWGYRRVGDADGVLVENVRWLAGYRQPRFLEPVIAWELSAAFAEGRELVDGAQAVGSPLVVLPVLFHLLWLGRPRIDLGRPMSHTSRMWSSS